MQEDSDNLEIIESFAHEPRCQECGRVWVDGEPLHHADCRYFVLDGELEENDGVMK